MPATYGVDLSRYSLIQGRDVASGLGRNSDLSAMDPDDFEHLVRQMFEMRGVNAWNTRRSGDQGVDAVLVTQDPLLGGYCIVQAKRYAKCIQPDAVRALAGVLGQDRHASKAIFVTTSWFGDSSWQFAREHGRIELIDGARLQDLLHQHLGIDVQVPSAPHNPSRR
ncbi:restriction endonuclease [Embleya sp. NPDC005575]|uniref:restriction endonuclease n=1 Tax=Embleya sp. NPDC005575 TaxID=3156892 RepID=UPI0033A202A5